MRVYFIDGIKVYDDEFNKELNLAVEQQMKNMEYFTQEDVDFWKKEVFKDNNPKSEYILDGFRFNTYIDNTEYTVNKLVPQLAQLGIEPGVVLDIVREKPNSIQVVSPILNVKVNIGKEYITEVGHE